MVSIVSSSFNSQAVLGLRRAAASKVRATENLATGSKLATANTPELVTTFRVRTDKSINASLMQNLAGALTYSQTQASSLRRMAGIIERLSDLVSLMQNAVQGEDDLNNYMIQFNAIRQDLVQARKEKYGDTSLHDTSGTSKPLKISLDGSAGNVMDLTQSNLLDEGAGALLALIGSSVQDFETTGPVVEPDSTDFGGLPAPAPSPAPVPVQGPTGAISGEEGWGTDSTNTPQALVRWGVQPLNDLLSSVSRLLTVNASHQSRIQKAIDKARERDASLSAFEGQIADTDVAFEVLNLAKSNMRTEAGLSAMAQSNASADSVAAALYGGAGAGIKWQGEDFSQAGMRASEPGIRLPSGLI
jgi:flagellin-like hook-associated protein FlgL